LKKLKVASLSLEVTDLILRSFDEQLFKNLNLMLKLEKGFAVIGPTAVGK